MHTETSLSIAAELQNLARIRDFVDQSVAGLGVQQPATIGDLRLAVDEAVTNIIVHGYQQQPGIVELEVARRADLIIIRIRDNAPPFDPNTVPTPDTSLPLFLRQPGGLGVHLVRQTTDEMRHRITSSGGNELVLVKQIGND